MIIVDGKEVFSELSELVDPKHTALIVIDMQKDFIDSDGVFGKMGIDLSMYETVKPRVRELLESAREHGVSVIHLQNTALDARGSDSPAQIRFNLRMHMAAREDLPALRYTIPGTTGHNFSAGFEPTKGEFVVLKYRSSGFWGTNLDLLLRSNAIQCVVIAGCTTEGCVESTARDALFANYFVTIAEDAVGSDDKSQHDASMLLMSNRFDIATTSTISKLWKEAIQ